MIGVLVIGMLMVVFILVELVELEVNLEDDVIVARLLVVTT